MANAFKDILGFAGNAADTVFLGGAVGKIRARNKFADFIEQGKFDEAENLALRKNAPEYAAFAQQQAALGGKQQEDENQIFSGLSIALSEITDPNARRMAFEAMKPGLSQRFGFDEEDFSQVPLDDANALRLFGQQFITPETQSAQLLTRQKQGEDARSNLATERLRSNEIDVSRGNLDVSRGRLALDRETQPNALNLERTKADREVFKDTQALRKEFSNVTGDFTSIRNNLNTINTVGSQKDSAGDLALLVSFTKLLDPNSVAREGEVRLAQSAAGLFENASVWADRIQKGQTLLPDDVRQRYIAAANQIGSQYDNAFKKRQQEFRQISEAGQIDPNLVLIGSNDPRAPNPAAPSVPNTGFTPEDEARLQELERKLGQRE